MPCWNAVFLSFFLLLKQNWYPQTFVCSLACRKTTSHNLLYNQIFFKLSQMQSHSHVFLQATKRRKKGGSNVALSVFLAAPCFWYSAKHGSLKALHSSTFKKPQRGKAVLHRPDVDSFRWKDSWCVGCHRYHRLFVVSIWRCCRTLSPDVLLWYKRIMRLCKSLSTTWW